MNKRIAVIPGDGIGPEITQQAVVCLKAIAKRFGHDFDFDYRAAGGSAIDQYGECLPKATLEACKESDSVLLGAVGGPKWDSLPGAQRPERALLNLRKELGLYANLRPAVLMPGLEEASPLKAELCAEGVDLIVVRELTGGVYFGEHSTKGDTATDIMSYSEAEVERIAHVAFKSAMKRKKKLCSIDKANVLDTSRLWRRVVERVAKEYPEVSVSNMYVDNAAMQLVRKPSAFDVILTENMFGDILSDEASMISGTIGVIGSASMGDGTRGLFEPIHGSAPDIAGSDAANPIGTILAAAMMLRYSFDMREEAESAEFAVGCVLEKGFRTRDMASEGKTIVGCREMGALICRELED